MSKPLTLALLLVVAVLAVVGAFLFSGDSVPLPDGAPAAAEDAQEPAPVAPAVDGAGRDADENAQPNDPGARVPVAPLQAAPVGGESPRLVSGQVVDDAGRPVADARVTCNAGVDFARVGAEIDLDAMDFEAMAEQARTRAGSSQTSSTTTDAQGRFQLTLAGTRDGFLRVLARGHQVLNRTVQRPEQGDLDLGVLTLTRGAIVSGRVTDAQGRPVAGARVNRTAGGATRNLPDFAMHGLPDAELVDFAGGFRWGGAEGAQDETDAEGRFELPYVQPGEFALRARHPDHPVARRDGLRAEAGQTLADVLVMLEPGTVIQGRVLDLPPNTRIRVQASARTSGPGATDESPMGVAFAMVGEMGEVMSDLGLAFGEHSVTPEADGSFLLRGLRVDQTYRVWGTQQGRGFAANATCCSPLEVPSGTRGLELRYDPGVTVTLQLVDATTGAPIERLWVRHSLRGGGGMEDMIAMAPRGAGRARDYPDGRVTIPNLRPKPKQTLQLTVGAIGHAELERENIPLPAAGTLDLGTIRLTASPVIEVTVASAVTGQPVPNATVRLQSDAGNGSDNPFERLAQMGARRGGPASGRTDEQGRCVLNAPNDERARLTVDHDQHAPFERDLVLADARNTRQDVTLLGGGRVEVTVLADDGTPLARQRIDHSPPIGRRRPAPTNDQGVAVFEHLAPGSHRFRIAEGGDGMAFALNAIEAGGITLPSGGDQGWSNVTVQDGATVTLQLSRNPGASLRGIVRSNGAPLAGARLALLAGTGDTAAADPAQAAVGAIMSEWGGGGRNARAGDDGTYQLKDLKPGQHRLRITHSDRAMPAVVPVTLHAGDNVLDVDLQTSTLRGTVRGPDGRPVARARVAVQVMAADGSAADPLSRAAGEFMPGIDLSAMRGGGAAVRSTDDGSFELVGVQTGARLVVRASADGFADGASAPIELAPGASRDGVDVTLGQAGSVHVTAGEVAPFTMVTAVPLGADGQSDAGTRPVSQMLRRRGTTLGGLRPGRWRVSLVTPGNRDGNSREVTVTAGATVNVQF